MGLLAEGIRGCPGGAIDKHPDGRQIHGWGQTWGDGHEKNPPDSLSLSASLWWSWWSLKWAYRCISPGSTQPSTPTSRPPRCTYI